MCKNTNHTFKVQLADKYTDNLFSLDFSSVKHS